MKLRSGREENLKNENEGQEKGSMKRNEDR